MKGVNKVILVGHVGRDPEVRYTASGQSVANFSVATSEAWKDKDGKKQEKTEWHRCQAWGKLADIAGEYVRKGMLVYCEGNLTTREWEKDGVKRQQTDVRVYEMQMLSRNDGEVRRNAAADKDSDSDHGGLVYDDDIPF